MFHETHRLYQGTALPSETCLKLVLYSSSKGHYLLNWALNLRGEVTLLVYDRDLLLNLLIFPSVKKTFQLPESVYANREIPYLKISPANVQAFQKQGK